MDRTNLVISKHEFSTGYNAFDAEKVYRCLPDLDGDDGFLINGEYFTKEEFAINFTFFVDIVKAEWEILGLTVNGKIISKAAFKRRANEGHHEYGSRREKLHVFFFYIHPKELMYGFYPSFKGNKADALNDAYDNYKNIMDGHIEALDDAYKCGSLVQRGNSGVPISYRDIRWRVIDNKLIF